jgi:hypothetical protein
MGRVVLEVEAGKFAGLTERVAVYDASGRTLGYFTPSASPSLYEGVEIPISDAELERISNEGGGRTLAEILADLEKRS